MARMNEKVKTKYIIKTLLCCNKGKKFSTKDICNFIIENKLHSRNTEINQNAIARLIKADQIPNSVLTDVKIEKIKGKNYYSIT